MTDSYEPFFNTINCNNNIPTKAILTTDMKIQGTKVIASIFSKQITHKKVINNIEKINNRASVDTVNNNQNVEEVNSLIIQLFLPFHRESIEVHLDHLIDDETLKDLLQTLNENTTTTTRSIRKFNVEEENTKEQEKLQKKQKRNQILLCKDLLNKLTLTYDSQNGLWRILYSSSSSFPHFVVLEQQNIVKAKEKNSNNTTTNVNHYINTDIENDDEEEEEDNSQVDLSSMSSLESSSLVMDSGDVDQIVKSFTLFSKVRGQGTRISGRHILVSMANYVKIYEKDKKEKKDWFLSIQVLDVQSSQNYTFYFFDGNNFHDRESLDCIRRSFNIKPNLDTILTKFKFDEKGNFLCIDENLLKHLVTIDPRRTTDFGRTIDSSPKTCQLPISQYIQPFQDRKLLISIYTIPNEQSHEKGIECHAFPSKDLSAEVFVFNFETFHSYQSFIPLQYMEEDQTKCLRLTLTHLIDFFPVLTKNIALYTIGKLIDGTRLILSVFPVQIQFASKNEKEKQDTTPPLNWLAKQERKQWEETKQSQNITPSFLKEVEVHNDDQQNCYQYEIDAFNPTTCLTYSCFLRNEDDINHLTFSPEKGLKVKDMIDNIDSVGRKQSHSKSIMDQKLSKDKSSGELKSSELEIDEKINNIQNESDLTSLSFSSNSSSLSYSMSFTHQSFGKETMSFTHQSFGKETMSFTPQSFGKEKTFPIIGVTLLVYDKPSSTISTNFDTNRNDKIVPATTTTISASAFAPTTISASAPITTTIAKDVVATTTFAPTTTTTVYNNRHHHHHEHESKRKFLLSSYWNSSTKAYTMEAFDPILIQTYQIDLKKEKVESLYKAHELGILSSSLAVDRSTKSIILISRTNTNEGMKTSILSKEKLSYETEKEKVQPIENINSVSLSTLGDNITKDIGRGQEDRHYTIGMKLTPSNYRALISIYYNYDICIFLPSRVECFYIGREEVSKLGYKNHTFYNNAQLIIGNLRLEEETESTDLDQRPLKLSLLPFSYILQRDNVNDNASTFNTSAASSVVSTPAC